MRCLYFENSESREKNANATDDGIQDVNSGVKINTSIKEL